MNQILGDYFKSLNGKMSGVCKGQVFSYVSGDDGLHVLPRVTPEVAAKAAAIITNNPLKNDGNINSASAGYAITGFILCRKAFAYNPVNNVSISNKNQKQTEIRIPLLAVSGVFAADER